MSDSSNALQLFVVLLIVLTNAFFAGAEVSLISVRPSRLRQLAAEGNLGAQAGVSLLENPERLLSVVQVGVTLASLGLGWAGEHTVYRMLTSALGPFISPGGDAVLHGVAFTLAFLFMTFLHVVLGEVVPKNLAIDKADRLAILVAPVLLVFYRASLPFVYVIEKSAAAISRLLGVRGDRGGGHSAEELKLIVSASRGLPERQEEMIHRVLELDNLYVREIMVPRNEIVSIPLDSDLEQVLRTMIEQQHSRLPVWEGQPEHILGVLHYKDLLPVWQQRRAAIRGGRPSGVFRVRPLLRQHLVVPETKPLLQMLEDFRQGRSHMAMVVDEFGTIVGLVTVEDVLEEIVGAIEDEYDEPLEQPAPEASEFELDGATKIRDLAVAYGIELPAGQYETLAGFILARLGCVPESGATVEHGGRRFTVLEMDRNRIARVRVEKPAA
ncbi:MAG: HlyC/CorC family transporter [Acidobacteria bacterium]|nr:HlyC/CorC family transporter [Acidobacteriota bacterium]